MKKSIYEELKEGLWLLVYQGKLTLENKHQWHDLACFVHLRIPSKYAAWDWLVKHDLGSANTKYYIKQQDLKRYGLEISRPERTEYQDIANLVIWYAGYSALADIESQLESYIHEKSQFEILMQSAS